MKKFVSKKNFYLLGLFVICLIGLIVHPTYAHFGEDYVTTDDVVGMTLTFDLGISSTEEYEEIILSPGAYQLLNVEVTNGTSNNIYYGIWYKMAIPKKKTDEIIIAKYEDTTTASSGELTGNQSKTVTLVIKNNSSDSIKVNIGVESSTSSTSDIEYLGGKHLITGESNLNLTGVPVGSYVKYIGNNGCSGASCSGQNANYVNDIDKGYCKDSTYKYKYNGWRIAYIDSTNVYLISAGSPECMCTNSDGTTSSSSCSTYEDISKEYVYHFDNLDNQSLIYCNKAFANENECTTTSSTWNFDATDFKNITSTELSSSCYNSPENESCGYLNPLIDVGSYYWIANTGIGNNDSDYYSWIWSAYYTSIGRSYTGMTTTENSIGIRPVIKLDASVIVSDGSGTYEDPYIIDNPTTIKDLSGNMNNGVNEGGTWDQDAGTIKISNNATDNLVNAGLIKYDFGDSASFVLRIKFHQIFSGEENSLMGNWEAGGGGLLLSKSGKIVYGFYMEDAKAYKYFVSTTVPELETWYTIVGVYDGTNLAIYLNGQALTWDSSSTDYPAYNSNTASGNITESSSPIALGVNPTSVGKTTASSYVDATYSDALIFTRALTESEITSDYSGEVNPSNTEDLVLHYNFIR